MFEARASLLERVFARAHERLAGALEAPAARERLLERAREALGLVPEGGARVICSPGVAKLLEGPLGEADGVRLETQDTLPAGFRVEGAGGAVVVDATLESLLALDRPLLSSWALRELDAEPA